MSMNTDNAANDLTQLSSREQLSALMDGALPPDQTRFLLRRLQHDAPLGECWERWRLAGEAMRGLAPAQRLPADFASRVSAALHGGVEPAPVPTARPVSWRRWGGGAAMAASLALVALFVGRPVLDPVSPDAAAPDAAVPVAAVPVVPTAAPRAPEKAPVVPAAEAGDAVQPLLAASVAAASVRPRRGRAGERELPRTAPTGRAASPAMQVAAAIEVPVPQPDIVTRPWPRSVLPQYASGGLAVGFGEHAHGASAYNPFAAPSGVGSLPPPARPADSPAAQDQGQRNDQP